MLTGYLWYSFCKGQSERKWRKKDVKQTEKLEARVERPWEKAKLKQRDAIKRPRARRVYPFQLSPDSHTGPANEKPTHANCQLGNLSVIWKDCQNLVCIISHISCHSTRPKTRSRLRCHVWLHWTAMAAPPPRPNFSPRLKCSRPPVSRLHSCPHEWICMYVCESECVKAYTPQWLVAGKWEEEGAHSNAARQAWVDSIIRALLHRLNAEQNTHKHLCSFFGPRWKWKMKGGRCGGCGGGCEQTEGEKCVCFQTHVPLCIFVYLQMFFLLLLLLQDCACKCKCALC